ncbi:MAG: aspartate/glutamate racemase family protein [Desulfatiglandales bacterium]|nr:aspartate/glutamate racemase family protein [Desulfatiglandales bacterium]
MKILWQDIFTPQIPFTDKSDLLWDVLARLAKEVKFGETEIDFAWLDRSSELNWYPYLELMNDLEIVHQIIKAEQNGYDAVIIGCYCDPALREARGIVDIPVIGLSEASMSVAQMIGGRFAVVTVWEAYVPILEKNLRLYGWESRCIANRPIRYFNIDWPKFIDAIQGDSDAILADFERIALSSIEDGADVIIVGCGYLGPLLTLLNYREVGETKVPVIDCGAAGIATAESMAKLHRQVGLSPSRYKTSPYPHPPAKKLAAIRKRFGFE